MSTSYIAHSVFVTEYRRNVLNKAMPDRYRKIMTKVRADFEAQQG